jgi:hypothetical protein
MNYTKQTETRGIDSGFKGECWRLEQTWRGKNKAIPASETNEMTMNNA